MMQYQNHYDNYVQNCNRFGFSYNIVTPVLQEPYAGLPILLNSSQSSQLYCAPHYPTGAVDAWRSEIDYTSANNNSWNQMVFAIPTVTFDNYHPHDDGKSVSYIPDTNFQSISRDSSSIVMESDGTSYLPKAPLGLYQTSMPSAHLPIETINDYDCKVDRHHHQLLGYKEDTYSSSITAKINANTGLKNIDSFTYFGYKETSMVSPTPLIQAETLACENYISSKRSRSPSSSSRLKAKSSSKSPTFSHSESSLSSYLSCSNVSCNENDMGNHGTDNEKHKNSVSYSYQNDSILPLCKRQQNFAYKENTHLSKSIDCGNGSGNSEIICQLNGSGKTNSKPMKLEKDDGNSKEINKTVKQYNNLNCQCQKAQNDISEEVFKAALNNESFKFSQKENSARKEEKQSLDYFKCLYMKQVKKMQDMKPLYNNECLQQPKDKVKKLHSDLDESTFFQYLYEVKKCHDNSLLCHSNTSFSDEFKKISAYCKEKLPKLNYGQTSAEEQVKPIEVVSILKSLSDKFGTLSYPILYLYDNLITNEIKGIPLMECFDEETVVLLKMIKNKLKKLMISSHVSLIQRTVYQESFERVCSLLKAINDKKKLGLLYGLHIEKLAIATVGKSCQDTFTFIKTLRVCEGLDALSDDQLMEVYLALKATGAGSNASKMQGEIAAAITMENEKNFAVALSLAKNSLSPQDSPAKSPSDLSLKYVVDEDSSSHSTLNAINGKIEKKIRSHNERQNAERMKPCLNDKRKAHSKQKTRTKNSALFPEKKSKIFRFSIKATSEPKLSKKCIIFEDDDEYVIRKEKPVPDKYLKYIKSKEEEREMRNLYNNLWTMRDVEKLLLYKRYHSLPSRIKAMLSDHLITFCKARPKFGYSLKWLTRLEYKRKKGGINGIT